MNNGDFKKQTNFSKIPDLSYSDRPEDMDSPNTNINNNMNNNINKENEIVNSIKEKKYEKERNIISEFLYNNDNQEENKESQQEKNLTIIEEVSNEISNINTNEKKTDVIIKNMNNNINILLKSNEESNNSNKNSCNNSNKISNNNLNINNNIDNIIQNDALVDESIIPLNREDNQDLMSIGPNVDIEKIVKNLEYGEVSMIEEDYLEVVPLQEVSDDEIFRNINMNEMEKEKDNWIKFKYEEKIIRKIYEMEKLFENRNINENIMNKLIKELDKKNEIIFAWREMQHRSDSFYRSVVFNFLEEIILTKNKKMFKIFINELNKNIENNYFRNRLNLYKLDAIKVKLDLIIIYNILFNAKDKPIDKAHMIFMKMYNSDKNFDRVLNLNLKFLIYNYISSNENKIYTQEKNVNIGKFLPKNYKIGEKYLFKEFYDNSLLRLEKEAETIAVYVLPFILRKDLYIYLFDGNYINHVWVHTSEKENQEFLPLRLFYFNNSYYVIYGKKYISCFKNIFFYYWNTNRDSNLFNMINSNNKKKSENILDDIDNFDLKKISQVSFNELMNQNNKFNNQNNNINYKQGNNTVNNNINYNNYNHNKYNPNNNKNNNGNNNIYNNNYLNINDYQKSNVSNNYKLNQMNNNYQNNNNAYTNNNNYISNNNNNLNYNNYVKQKSTNENINVNININNNYNNYQGNNNNYNNHQENQKYNNDIARSKTYDNFNLQKANSTNSCQCPGCKYPGKNGFYCENCSLNILIKFVTDRYISLIQSNKYNLIKNKQTETLTNFLNNLNIVFPNKMVKKFQETYYSLSDMNKNVFDTKFNLFKSCLCIGCFTFISNEPHFIQNNKNNNVAGVELKINFITKFPCGCSFCSPKCLEQYLNSMPLSRMNKFICGCGEEYNCIKLKYLLYFAISHNLFLFKEQILRIMYDNMKNKCCICDMEVPLIEGKKNKFNILEIWDKEIEQIFKITKFNHLLCNKCVKNKDISKKKLFFCNMCSSQHSIINIKNIENGQIRNNCCIF